MKIETHDADTLGSELAKHVAENLRAAIDAHGRASIAVAGGSTPAPFLSALSGQDLDWEKVAITLTDERCVPPTDARSNQRMVAETLLQGPAARARFVPLYGEGTETIGRALEDAILPLSICVLGMGEDMHTASLFPETPGLADLLDVNSKRIIAEVTPPGAPESRITLTAAPLAAAGHVYLLIKGKGKRDALDQAMQTDDPLDAPIRAILDAARHSVIFYAD